MVWWQFWVENIEMQVKKSLQGCEKCYSFIFKFTVFIIKILKVKSKEIELFCEEKHTKKKPSNHCFFGI